MRLRSVAAIALVIPSAAFAQLVPRVGGARPRQPVPLGRQPDVVRRSIQIQRSRYAIETYPLISHVLAPGYSDGHAVSSWNTFGAGTRLDYRYTRFVSWTFDLTGSTAGVPATTETAELGMRLHPEDAAQRLRPFADARLGFEHSSDQYATQFAGSFDLPSYALAQRYSRGFGGIVGAGVEYSLTNSFSLTTGVSAMRTNMSTYRYTGTSVPTPGDGFRMTTYRLAIGLRYNPASAMRSAR
ncbi:hypothetical protein BH09GEM1_BH09GEM1_05580 [soil metagenome]